MSYSRRQLEAALEPFGECATRLKPGGRIYGGGSQPSTPTSTTQTSLNYSPTIQPMVTEAAQRAVAETSTPYTNYGGQRIAGFDPFQLTAQQDIANLTPAQQLGPATQYAASAGAQAGNIQYQPQQFGTTSFTAPGVAQQYMSPYVQDVVDIQKREAQRQADIANQQQQAQAVSRGAYGGSRQAIVQSEAARNLAQQMNDIQKAGNQAAYEQAQNLYGTEAARAQQAQQLAEQSRQYGAGLGLQGLQTQLQASGQLGNLGQEQMSQQQGIINALNAAGQQRQALNQEALSQQYQDFLTQKQYPYQQLSFLMEMLKGTPQQTAQQIYQAPPSTAAMLGGLGTALYGANKLFAGGGHVQSNGLEDLVMAHLSKG
jgi:hypothetical protein